MPLKKPDFAANDNAFWRKLLLARIFWPVRILTRVRTLYALYIYYLYNHTPKVVPQTFN
jgi:hypothetical protein